MIVTCKNCGVKLFEDNGYESMKPKPLIQFRSFATRTDDDGNEYYLCIDCHEGMNKEYFESKQTD